tara:strand:- start:1188 stop:2453 length:1266 start_codon:yes stop_codon:yes gene_type:complete
MLSEIKIAVYGLGYVGLPLALKFGEKFKTIGFDIDPDRINDLKNYIDKNAETTEKEFKRANLLTFTSKWEDIKKCNFFIVTLPTPIDDQNNPDLTMLENGTKEISKCLKPNDIVVYESTVFPGCTEEFMVPILEASGLKYNHDFFCGYSPERINPGDKTKSVSDIVKITSGSNEKASRIIHNVYSEIIDAGIYSVNSIKIAEAAKVIENIQRDINIALINELSIIFNKINIDTEEVLQAAETKWNFQKFRPGLVGGHCIGVDPYYLTFKSRMSGYEPKFILSGRNVNNKMSDYIVKELTNLMRKKNIKIKNSNLLILGVTFKENCKDIRNSKVFEIINKMSDLGTNVDICDPWVKTKDLPERYKSKLVSNPSNNYYDTIILAVAHDEFKKKAYQIIKYKKRKSIIYDLKHILPKEQSDLRL